MEWVDTYGIHHWRILWSSYRRLVWLGFEPTTTEFRSDALTEWAIRSWVQLALRANFVQLFQFHHLFSVKFHFGYGLRQSPRLLWLRFSWGNRMSVAEWMIHMVFTTEGFFELTIGFLSRTLRATHRVAEKGRGLYFFFHSTTSSCSRTPDIYLHIR